MLSCFCLFRVDVPAVDVTTASACGFTVLFRVCRLVATGQSHTMLGERPLCEEAKSRKYPRKGTLATTTPTVKRRLIKNLLPILTGICQDAILHSTDNQE